jgi:hypothetical protein
MFDRFDGGKAVVVALAMFCSVSSLSKEQQRDFLEILFSSSTVSMGERWWWLLVAR